MTNREASEILTQIKNTPQVTWTNGADIAFDLAIKALEEKPRREWKQIPLKTLDGDDIVAYESSCCGAVADKKYQCCPKCNEKMEV